MIDLIEYGSGVIEVETLPDAPGIIRRTFSARQLSGRPLTIDQWRRFANACAEDMRRRGLKVHRLCFITIDGEEVG